MAEQHVSGAVTGTRPMPASPCRRECTLDEHDTCLGCGRTLEEIIGWRDMSDTRREEVLQLALQRRAQRLARREQRQVSAE